MAEKKTLGFRFRLPWLLQPSLPPTREPPTQTPRTTTQTSVASTTAQRPPFRPPGKAPAPPPPTVATPAPFSARRSPPQSVASPPPSVSPKSSSVPKSPTAKNIEPVASQPAKETQATIETPVLATLPQTPPFSPPRQAHYQPSSPQTPPPSPPPSVSPKSMVPKSPIPKTTEPVAAQPAKETETKLNTETAGPATPPLSPPLSPPTQAQSQPSPPQIPRPPSPFVLPESSVPTSPIAKTTEPVAAQPTKETQTTPKAADPATPPTQAQSEPSPPQTPPPPNHSQTRTPPPSPSQLASEPAEKTSSLSSPPTQTTSEVSENKTSTEIIKQNFPADSKHIPQGNHPREITQIKSMNSHPTVSKSQKPNLTTTTRIPLHREIKDDISKLIHKLTTSSAKQLMNEEPASIVTIAGDNTGASMHLGSDEIKRGNKLTTDKEKEPNAIVNSNVQGINNSMMFNSSVMERNPGVHLGFYGNLANINGSMMENMESIGMQKAEVNVTPPEKVVYDPTIGRSPEWEFEADDAETSGKSYEIEVL